MVSRHDGMTLIELLAVLAIIGTIAGMILAVAPLIRRRSDSARTQAILTVVKTALTARTAERASLPSPVPHPLAGSSCSGGITRSLFVRAIDGTTAIATTGEALVVDNLSWVAVADRNRALMPDDIFSGRTSLGDVPALFGLPRSQLSILGTAGELYVRYRQLPKLSATYDTSPADGLLDSPYTSARYPNRTHLVRGGISFKVATAGSGYLVPPILTVSGGTGIRATAVISNGAVSKIILDDAGDPGPASIPTVAVTSATGDPGSGAAITCQMHNDDAAGQLFASAIADHLAELAGLGALAEPGSTRCADDLLAADEAPTAVWRARTISLTGSWQRYRVRGQALYDVWGSEILYWSDPSTGTLKLTSAGPDGHFALKPDSSGGYNAADLLPGFQPGHRDATRDNITVEVGR
jgi:prepilin-type N-terminal cleavage/methylation domain-containing protein